MKEEKLQKICQIIKESTLRQITLKAEQLPKRIKVEGKPKRSAFEKYSYSQNNIEQLEPQEEKYCELQQKAKQQITKKINQYLIDEQIARLQMEMFIINHSIATQQNLIEEAKIKINSKQNTMTLQLNAIKKSEKAYKRPKISARSSRREPSEPRSPLCSEFTTKRLRICPSQNVKVQPEKQKDLIQLQQRKKLRIDHNEISEYSQNNLEKHTIDYKKLACIVQIDKTIEICEQKLQKNNRSNRREDKKQCMQLISKIWKKMHQQGIS